MTYFRTFSYPEKLERFGLGEWMEEPDLFRFIHSRISCIIMRHSEGFLIGMCQLPKDHPWCHWSIQKIDLDIHGQKFIIKEMNGEFVGFSCDMIGDLVPSKYKEWKIIEQVSDAFNEPSQKELIYRNMQFAMNQCRYLSEQIVEAHEPIHKSKIVYEHERNG